MINIETFYRYLHENPELSGLEKNTQYYIEENLKKYASKIHKINYSILGYFDKGCKETIAFRTEMDALPILENSNHKIISQNNNMHACGHDVHMSALLKLAKDISTTKLSVNVILIFQSSEEENAKSIDIVNSNILQQYNTTKIFGMHVWPNLDKHRVFSNELLMYGSTELDIIIEGKESHVSNLNPDYDALKVCNNIYKKLNKLSNKDLIHCGVINSGTRRNIQSNYAQMSYTIRYSNKYKIIKKILTTKYKTKCNIYYNLKSDYPSLKCSKELITRYNVELINPIYAAEDFGNYNRIGECLYLLFGLGTTFNLHTSNFETTQIDREIYYKVIKKILMSFK